MKLNHPHIFIANLVYPAFLGALIFEFSEEFRDMDLEQFFICALIVIHFIFDFVYTADEKRKKIYSNGRMLIDLILIIFLYISVKNSLNLHIIGSNYYIWLSLFAFKAASFVWEWAGEADENIVRASVTHTVFAAVYLTGAIFSGLTWQLIAVLLVDVAMYYNWGKLSNPFKKD